MAKKWEQKEIDFILNNHGKIKNKELIDTINVKFKNKRKITSINYIINKYKKSKNADLSEREREATLVYKDVKEIKSDVTSTVEKSKITENMISDMVADIKNDLNIATQELMKQKEKKSDTIQKNTTHLSHLKDLLIPETFFTRVKKNIKKLLTNIKR